MVDRLKAVADLSLDDFEGSVQNSIDAIQSKYPQFAIFQLL